MQTGYRYSEGSLVTTAGDSVADRLVATGAEVDLYQVRNRVKVGNAMVLAVLALNDSGKPARWKQGCVVRSPMRGPGQHATGATQLRVLHAAEPVPATTCVVSLSSSTARAGSIHIEWYRNLTLYSTDQQSGGTAWTFTCPRG